MASGFSKIRKMSSGCGIVLSLSGKWIKRFVLKTLQNQRNLFCKSLGFKLEFFGFGILWWVFSECIEILVGSVCFFFVGKD